MFDASIIAYLGVNPFIVPKATKEASVDLKKERTSNDDVGAVDGGLVMLDIVRVKVCAGIVEDDEFMFVS